MTKNIAQKSGEKFGIFAGIFLLALALIFVGAVVFRLIQIMFS